MINRPQLRSWDLIDRGLTADESTSAISPSARPSSLCSSDPIKTILARFVAQRMAVSAPLIRKGDTIQRPSCRAYMCHIRQPLHGGALVVRREMRVLARNGGALVPYDFARSTTEASCASIAKRDTRSANASEGNASFLRSPRPEGPTLCPPPEVLNKMRILVNSGAKNL